MKPVGLTLSVVAAQVHATSKASTIPELKYPPVDMAVKVLRSAAEGLNLYEHVDRLTVCDYHTQSFLSTLVDSASTFWGSDGETDFIREGIWLFTDSLGLSSYALRTCYASYVSLQELHVHYWDQIGNFPEAAAEAHNNVIQYQNELNEQGYAAFVGIFMGRYQDFTFGITRAIYLTVLEAHFKTYEPGTVVLPKQAKAEKHSQQLFADAETGKKKEHRPIVRGIWPLERYIFNDLHYLLEMTYEFIRGSRLVPKEVLDVCETRLTNFMLVFNEASDHIEMGQLLEDSDAELEGWFRIFDSFLLLTDLGRGCWDTYWRVGNSTRKFVTKNVLSTERTLVNLMHEYFLLSNNMAVFFADFFFQDWLSFAYYAGDSVYRLLVVQHKNSFDWDLD